MQIHASPRDAGRPEEMFLAWVFGLPDGVDVGDAARSEIARIDGIAAPSDQLLMLRTLLEQATLTMTRQSRRHRLRRH